MIQKSYLTCVCVGRVTLLFENHCSQIWVVYTCKSSCVLINYQQCTLHNQRGRGRQTVTFCIISYIRRWSENLLVINQSCSKWSRLIVPQYESLRDAEQEICLLMACIITVSKCRCSLQARNVQTDFSFATLLILKVNPKLT